jgi:hypothetical protein
MTISPSVRLTLRFLAVCAIIGSACLISAGLFVVMDPTPARAGSQTAEWLALTFVGGFSGLVGYAELAQRYRDDPARMFASSPTAIYCVVNIAAGVGAFALVRAFRVFDPATPHAAIYGVLLASFGAIAFFRTSLFTARVGDTNADIGPATLLKALLEASDRMINRA